VLYAKKERKELTSVVEAAGGKLAAGVVVHCVYLLLLAKICPS
jgi:hypothetical protein